MDLKGLIDRVIEDMALEGLEHFRRQDQGPQGMCIPHKNLF